MGVNQKVFGSYSPGKTIFHRLDARVKIFLVMLLAVTVFLFDNRAEISVLLIFYSLLLIIARVPCGRFWQGIKPFIFLLALTIVLQALTAGGPVWFSAGFLKISREGVAAGILVAYKVVLLLVGVFLLNYTTSPMEMTEAMARILSPLRKAGLPVQEIAFMMTMTLRFIPLLEEEAGRIWTAFKSRGIQGLQKWWKRPIYLIYILVPLLAGIFRRSEYLANSMEARGYRSGASRSSMRQFSAGRAEGLALGIVLVLVVVLWLI